MNGLDIRCSSGSSYPIGTYANVTKSLPVGAILGLSRRIVARSNNNGEKWAWSKYGQLFSGNGHDLHESVFSVPPRHRPPLRQVFGETAEKASSRVRYNGSRVFI